MGERKRPVCGANRSTFSERLRAPIDPPPHSDPLFLPSVPRLYVSLFPPSLLYLTPALPSQHDGVRVAVHLQAVCGIVLWAGIWQPLIRERVSLCYSFWDDLLFPFFWVIWECFTVSEWHRQKKKKLLKRPQSKHDGNWQKCQFLLHPRPPWSDKLNTHVTHLTHRATLCHSLALQLLCDITSCVPPLQSPSFFIHSSHTTHCQFSYHLCC